MVGAVGFEPTAFCSRSKRATRLRYAPTNSVMQRRVLYPIHQCFVKSPFYISLSRKIRDKDDNCYDFYNRRNQQNFRSNLKETSKLHLKSPLLPSKLTSTSSGCSSRSSSRSSPCRQASRSLKRVSRAPRMRRTPSQRTSWTSPPNRSRSTSSARRSCSVPRKPLACPAGAGSECRPSQLAKTHRAGRSSSSRPCSPQPPRQSYLDGHETH